MIVIMVMLMVIMKMTSENVSVVVNMSDVFVRLSS